MKSISAQLETLMADLESAGLSRREIASRAGLSKCTVWRFANGEAREPGFDAVRRIESLHDAIVRKSADDARR